MSQIERLRIACHVHVKLCNYTKQQNMYWLLKRVNTGETYMNEKYASTFSGGTMADEFTWVENILMEDKSKDQ